MRYPLRLQASALLLAMVLPLAQGQAAEHDDEATVEALRKEMQSLDQELADFSADRREQLMADIEDVLAAIEDRIATLDNHLQENWETADELARAQAQTALAALRRERARATEWHQRMKDSPDFTWESMKDGFNDAFDDLSETWQGAEQGVRKAIEEN